jgi:hypothetical protein
MADVASPFNPTYEKKHEESYLNYSRGADAPRARPGFIAKENSNLAANAANLFAAGVEVKDKLYETAAKEFIEPRVDAVRDAWIGASAEGGAPNNANEPVDLTKMGERMAKMTASYKAGNINDRHYWAQMDSIARAARSRYPGYREYIDAKISSMTGGTPANVLQRSIADQASNADPEAKAFDDLLTRASFDDDGIEIPDSIIQSRDRQALLKYVNEHKVVSGDLKRRREAIQDAKNRGDIEQSNLNSTYSKDIWGRIGLSQKKDLASFTQEKVDALLNGAEVTPDQLVTLQNEALAFKSKLLSIYQEVNTDPLYTGVDPTRRTQEQATVTAMADNLIESIGKKDWTQVDILRNKLAILSTGEAINVWEASPTLRGVSSSREIGGPEAVTGYLSGNGPDGRARWNGMDKELNDYHLKKLQDPNIQNTPLVNTLDQISNSQNITDRKGLVTNAVDKSILSLTDKGFSPAAKERAALNMFGPGNQDFLQFFDPSDNTDPNKDKGSTRVSIFRKFTSPAVAKAMIEVRDNSPRGQELYNNYVQWRDYSFNTLFKTTMDTLKSIPTDDQTMNIQFDTSTGKIIMQSRGRTEFSVWDQTASKIKGSVNAINNFNASVDAMTPTWKLEGLDPGQEALKLISNAGVDLNAAKGDNMLTQFYKAVGGAIDEVTTKANEGASNVKDRRAKAGVGTSDNRVPDGMMRLGYGNNDRQSANVEDRRNETKSLKTRFDMFLQDVFGDDNPYGKLPETDAYNDDDALAKWIREGLDEMFKKGPNK